MALSASIDEGQLSQLSWLAGSWFNENGRVEEHWMAPREGLMVGMIRNLDRGSFYEYLRIEATEDGVFYISQPKGRTENRFRLVSIQPHRVTFENVENHSVLNYYLNEAGRFCGSLDLAEGERYDWCSTRGTITQD